MSSLVFLCIVVAAIITLALIMLALRSRGKNSAKLKIEYDQALKSGNKARALYAGRAYYESTHTGNRLSIQDEQAITNDLSSM